MYQGINYSNTDWEIDEVASVRVMLQYLTGKSQLTTLIEKL